MREEQFYGGSAREAEDSRRWQGFLNQNGELVVRRESGKVVLSCRPLMPCSHKLSKRRRMKRNITITAIERNPDFMMRDTLDKTLIAQYKDNLEIILATAPITVYESNEGEYILTDGFHRISAACQLNMETIPAIVFRGTRQDAHAAACLANLQHGKPLSRNERQNAIREFIKLRVKWSNRRIADEVGISDVTVLRYRRLLEANGEIEPQDKREGKDERIIQKPTATNVAVKAPQTPFIPTESEPPDPYQEWFDDHVLFGDALEIMPTLIRKYDLAIVDPPYGITTEGWDLTNKHELLVFTRRWLNQALQLLKSTGRLYVFWSRQYMFELKPLLDEIIETYPLEFGGMLVWYFRNVQSQPDSRKRYKLGWEPIFYYYGLDAPELNFPRTEITGESWKGRGDVQSDVWTFAIPQSNFTNDQRIHPTQKPCELYQRIIETATHRNDSIIDPFGGSGTTAHAALLTGRRFTLIEQNPDYVAKIHKRLKPIWEKEQANE